MEEYCFPEDKKWLGGNFQSLDHLTSVFQVISDYIKGHFPSHEDYTVDSSRASFFIEDIDVVFVDEKACPRTLVHVGFAESRLVIKMPDRAHYTDEIREQIRLERQLQFSVIVKESHSRVMVLFWELLMPEARALIEQEALAGLDKQE